MKKIKINWDYECYSNNNSWENSISPEYNIYIDNIKNIEFSKKNIVILYEPKSIIPNFYEQIIREKDKFHKVFTHRKELCDGLKVFNMPPFVPQWISKEDSRVYEKTKLCSMIASTKLMCKGHEYRQEIANKFPYKESLFGQGRNFIERKIDGLKDYMFSVAMENEVSDLYYTEKILDCFLTSTIPIYWGSNTISSVFNPKGMLWLEELDFNHLSRNLYLEKLVYVRENLEIAKKIKSGANDMIDFIIGNL